MKAFNLQEIFSRAIKKSIVIVEIGNDWLKIIEGAASGKGVTINKVSLKKLAQIKESILDVVSKAFKDLKLSKQNVILCIPRHLVTVRILELPSVNPQEISDIINLQISKQTPYSKDEIISAYKIVDNHREGYTRVILAIVRRNIVAERMDVLLKAGVSVDKIILSSEGLFNWFTFSYLPGNKSVPSGDIIVVDIDSNYSDFMVISKGRIIFTKNILIGANSLIEEKDVYLNNFTDELKHAQEIYQEESRAPKPVKLFLSGAAKNIADLDKILSAKVDIACETIDSLKNSPIKDLSVLKEEGIKFVSFTSVIGAALKNKELGLLLMPNEMRIAKIIEEKRKNLTITGILSCAIIMLISLFILVNIYNKNTYIRELKDRNNKIKVESDGVDKMRRAVNLLQGRLDAKGDTLSLLNEVYKLTPKEIYLTTITIERKKQLILKGRANAMSDVFKFVTALENSPNFKSVKNTYTTTKKENNQEYADFEIAATYESGNE